MEPNAGLSEAATTALVKRHFTRAGEDPFDSVEWGIRDARAGDFFQANVECPADWSDDSIGVVAKLYFATVDGIKETSVRQMIHRVVAKITLEGVRQGHFGPAMDLFNPQEKELVDEWLEGLECGDPARIFYDELAYICLHQMAAFNTPVWLNIGVPGRKQIASACYLLGVEDSMTDIVEWWREESLIFKAGAGAGIDVSRLRGSMEDLSSGGKASGPLAYMRVADVGAGTLKSGGAARRAAKLVTLAVDHPDIREFIALKPREDKRMRDLAAAGHNLDPSTRDGERNIAECCTSQNANHSVRVTDDFMRLATQSYAEGSTSPIWNLKARVTGEITETLDPRDLLRDIASSAWQCADPGLQFIDRMNEYHTTPQLGPITANPCMETHQSEDTACNLCCLNIVAFQTTDGFDVEKFTETINVVVTAMDILCGFGEHPTEKIERNTRDYRHLGLGVSNLGAAIMRSGLAYDSDEGRSYASSIVSLMTGSAYSRSAELAMQFGSYAGYDEEAHMGVISRHMDHLPEQADDQGVWGAASDAWAHAHAMGLEHGYRNAQATVGMPAGTTSFLLGCDTTGIEPAFTLVTHKNLAGGGSMVLTNRSVKVALDRLGYTTHEKAVQDGDLSGLTPEHRAIFATAIGENAISAEGHIKMLADLQPWWSGAASKTVNLPNSVTVDEILDAYVMAWELGCKAVSIYRDGSKATQAIQSMDSVKKVTTELKGGTTIEEFPNAKPGHPNKIITDEVESMNPTMADLAVTLARGMKAGEDRIIHASLDDQIAEQVEPRQRMPRTRQAIVHKIHVRGQVSEHEGYLHAGMYEDGRLGEIFIEGFGKSGGFTQNALSAWATAFSIGLQYGVPMEVLCRKHAYTGDETGGMVVPDPQGELLIMRTCTSIIDYAARWLIGQFGDVDLQEELGVMTPEVKERKSQPNPFLTPPEPRPLPEQSQAFAAAMNGHKAEAMTGPPCTQCGSSMHRTGACWTCPSCGASSGGCG